MAEGKRTFDVPDVSIPDLDLRSPSGRPQAGPGSSTPASAPPPQARPPIIDDAPFDIERGMSAERMAMGQHGPMAGAGAPMPSSGLDLDAVPSSQRNIQAAAPASERMGPAAGAHAPPASQRATPARLELDRRRPQSAVEYVEEPAPLVQRILARMMALLGFAGAAAAGYMYIHRSGGRQPMGLLPHAWDGTSMKTAAAVSLAMFVLSMAFGIWGFITRPRTWGFVLAGGLMLLQSLGMVTVALASSGESGVPPDGALLVPWLTPAFLVLLGLGVSSRAATMWERGGWGRRLATLPVGAIGGAIAFVGYEISRFA
jgi:hypothetical protein